SMFLLVLPKIEFWLIRFVFPITTCTPLPALLVIVLFLIVLLLLLYTVTPLPVLELMVLPSITFPSLGSDTSPFAQESASSRGGPQPASPREIPSPPFGEVEDPIRFDWIVLPVEPPRKIPPYTFA